MTTKHADKIAAPSLNIEEQLKCLRLLYAEMPGVEYWSTSSNEWKEWTVWSCPIYPQCHPGVDSPTILRLKPQRKFVPWTFSNCPVGTQIMHRITGNIYTITGKSPTHSAEIHGVWITLHEIYGSYVQENGQPCGTECEVEG